MLTARLPYGTRAANARSRAAQQKLRYRCAIQYNRDMPVRVDGAPREAPHPNPGKHCREVPEFVFELRHPGKALLNRKALPLFDRDPERFWKALYPSVGITVVGLLIFIVRS